jgi:hypothetical protein
VSKFRYVGPEPEEFLGGPSDKSVPSLYKGQLPDISMMASKLLI